MALSRLHKALDILKDVLHLASSKTNFKRSKHTYYKKNSPNLLDKSITIFEYNC